MIFRTEISRHSFTSAENYCDITNLVSSVGEQDDQKKADQEDSGAGKLI